MSLKKLNFCIKQLHILFISYLDRNWYQNPCLSWALITSCKQLWSFQSKWLFASTIPSLQVVSNLWRNRHQPKLCHQGLAFWAHPCLHRLFSRLLVRVRACGVNPVDAKYIIGDKFPESWMDWSARRVNGNTLGFDFSGEVVKSPPGCGYKVCIYNCRIWIWFSWG